MSTSNASIEIFADDRGIVIEQRRAGHWEFIPNRPVGRPRSNSRPRSNPPASEPIIDAEGLPIIDAEGLLSILPDRVIIEHLRLVSA
jgi:hypothetical protein